MELTQQSTPDEIKATYHMTWSMEVCECGASKFGDTDKCDISVSRVMEYVKRSVCDSKICAELHTLMKT